MAFFNRVRKHANTTPVFESSTKQSFWISLTKVFAVPMIPILLLMWFGSPALRISYTWNGVDEAPSYSHCVYLSLSGWHEIYPRPGINQCPLATFFPLNITDFLGG